MDGSITKGIGMTLYRACILHSACGGWMDRSITEGIGTTLYGACILHSACGFLLVYERIPNIHYKGEDIASDWAYGRAGFEGTASLSKSRL
jgi:hypothetical protein